MWTLFCRWWLFFFLLGLFPFTSLANDTFMELKLGGWSKHFERQEAHLPSFNEVHQGIGLEYNSNDGLRENQYWFVGASYLKDSYRMDAYGIAAGWKRRWAYRDVFIDMGVFTGVQSRSQAISKQAKDRSYYFSDIDRVLIPVVGTQLSLGYQGVTLNLALIPVVYLVDDHPKLQRPLLFLQFGIHLSFLEQMMD